MGTFVSSVRYALAGLRDVRSERNFKIDLVCAISVIVVGLFVGLDALSWALIALCIGMQLAFETMNTAIEATVDLYSLERTPLARKAKDCAAAAAFLSACACVVVALCIFVPRVLFLVHM